MTGVRVIRWLLAAVGVVGLIGIVVVLSSWSSQPNPMSALLGGFELLLIGWVPWALLTVLTRRAAS